MSVHHRVSTIPIDAIHKTWKHPNANISAFSEPSNFDPDGSYSRPLSQFITGGETLPDYFYSDSSKDSENSPNTPFNNSPQFEHKEYASEFFQTSQDVTPPTTFLGPEEKHSVDNPTTAASFAGLTSPGTVQIRHSSLNPIDKVKQDMQCLIGGDQVFVMSMGYLFSKLAIALDDPNSAYLFRDFAGNFTEFLDRFGPGAYDCFRAPKGISWIIKLILPWLQVVAPLNPSQYSVYVEVSTWSRNIVHLLGHTHAEEILEEGLWDNSCEQMAQFDTKVTDIAFKTAKKIVTTLPLNKQLIYKVLLIRNGTMGYDDVEMFNLRHNRTKLISILLERIDCTTNNSNLTRHASYLKDISNEICHSFPLETNALVKDEIAKCIDYVNRLAETFNIEPINISTEIPLQNLSRIGSYKERSPISEAVVKERFWKRVSHKIGRVFYPKPTIDIEPQEYLTVEAMKTFQREAAWSPRPRFKPQHDTSIPHAMEIERNFMNIN